MHKQTLLLLAPVATRSGYGARSRDIAKALIALDRFDIKIWSTPWGSTPMNALNPSNPDDKAILDRLLKEPKLESPPDVFIQISVPNEFQKIGRFNIGITAGIETTNCSAPWIEGCNKMDLILTSSEHSKNVFLNSVFEKVDNNTKQKVGELKVEVPVEVLFEGIDTTIYNSNKKVTHKTLHDKMRSIPESWCFLFVGHWLKGEFGQDRKDVGGLIQTFYQTFKNKQNAPALILKTSHADFSPIDRIDIMNKIEKIRESNKATRLPNVYLIHGDLEDEEMNSLYNHPKVKAHITFTKGEGYGRPLAEASLSKKPVIASDWSGHLDFLQHGVKLRGGLNHVHPSAAWENVILQESQWFTVDYAYASAVMRDVFENYKNYEINAKKQATLVRKEFCLEKMQEKLGEILENLVPKQVQLQLPKLQKIQLPKLKKVETNEQ